MTATTTVRRIRSRSGRKEGAAKETRGLFAIAGAACVACCIGPIMAVLGGATVLGLASTTVTGVGGSLVAAVAVAAALAVLRRRRASACARPAASEPVPVELAARR